MDIALASVDQLVEELQKRCQASVICYARVDEDTIAGDHDVYTAFSGPEYAWHGLVVALQDELDGVDIEEWDDED